MNIHALYGRILVPFRKARMRRFEDRFGLSSDTRVLDVGGTTFNWNYVREMPDLVLLNVVSLGIFDNRDVKLVIGDGRQMPFREDQFDIVFSNSVIEHVGSREDQRQFAKDCSRVGRGLFVQTPNRGFFFEPHLLTPFIHWLPLSWQRRLVRNFTVRGVFSRPSQEWVDEFLDATHMLRRDEMRRLFPDGEVIAERFLGFAKSIVVVRLPM